jgi:ABC-type cobalt transport system substrate-binding protein
MDGLEVAGLVGLPVQVEAWAAEHELRLLLVQAAFSGTDNQVHSLFYTMNRGFGGFLKGLWEPSRCYSESRFSY